MKWFRPFLLSAIMAVVGPFGCGPRDVPRASVSGQIKYRGVPLPVGTVSFVSESTSAVETGMIKDGRYTVERAPVGVVKISVVTPAPTNQMQMKQKVEGKSLEGSIKSVPVPEKYQNPDKSDLKYTVTTDKTQSYDIDLK